MLPVSRRARKNDAAVIRTGCLGQLNQCVLTGPARTDYQNEPAGSDRGQQLTGYGRRVRHATRCPSRHALRTTGTSRTTTPRLILRILSSFDAQIEVLKSSGPDILMIDVAPAVAARALRKTAELD
jgi:hypothetical protein